LIGSNNAGKALELAELLDGLPWDVKSLADYPPIPAPEEDGDTFEANAAIKARYFSGRFNVHCVADDSGLIVDVLDGRPGIRSARYAGEGCSHADNNRKLPAELDGVAEADRKARFVCWAALADPSGHIHTENGCVKGRIAFTCRGTHGFGYDPLFIPEGFSETFGEMDPAQKQTISHRANALRKLRAYLESLA
jgi:XTP/dITP diphosphohydrolase